MGSLVDLEIKKELDALTKKVEELKLGAVPIGFVYTQLPGLLDPTELWPDSAWEEISHKFAGLFFRVLGGSSARFGNEQEGDAPRITRIEVINGAGHPSRRDIPLNWSQPVGVGIWGSESYGIGMKVHTVDTEVKPRNTAVKLWKRVE